MKTEIINVQRLETPTIPNGQYNGIWSGYSVTFVINGITHKGHTMDGIRGKAPCLVTVEDGLLTVETEP